MPNQRLATFAGALARRSFLQWLISYAIVTWGLLEFLGFLIDTYGWSPTILRVATAAGVAGVSTMATIAWFHGKQGKQHVSSVEAVVLSLSLVLVVGSGWLAWSPASPALSPSPPDIVLYDGPSIAVMQFEILGEGIEPFLSDGIVEEVIGRLSELPFLKVASRNSTYALSGEIGNDPQRVGNLLGVSYVLYGVVQQVEDQIRVRASLVNAESGLQEWSNRYDMNNPNVFDLQDRIALDVADSMALTLSPDGEGLPPTGRDPQAFALFAEARTLYYTLQQENLWRSIELYREAIRLQPDYALAYAALLESYIILGFNYVDPNTILNEAVNAALRAIQLPAPNSSIYQSLAFFQMVTGDLDSAEVSIRNAIDIDPQVAEHHGFYATFLTYTRRFDEARRELDIASSLDRSSLQGLSVASYMNYFAGNYDEALRWANQVIDIFPGYPLIYLWRGSVYEVTGSYEQALADYRRETGVVGSAAAHAAGLLHKMGRTEESLAELEALEHPPAGMYIDVYRLAIGYVGVQQYDRAFELLNQAAQINSFHLITIDVEPLLDPIRDDPRFQALRESAGLATRQ